MNSSHPNNSLNRFLWLSIAAALITIILKFAAYWVTHSVGLLSDALESFVNLAGALMALAMLTIAVRPADDDHSYGHGKAEYFSSGVEGTLILVAAIGIIISAVDKLFNPVPLEQLGMGMVISAVSSLINLGTAIVLRRAAHQYKSITLEANSHHLFTDVWSSVGILIGVGAVILTNQLWLDSVAALLIAGNIIWTGVSIVRRSILGLMDTALPKEEIAIIGTVLAKYSADGVEYHALRTRQSGMRRFVSFHVLVPGEWTVDHGHHLLEQIETEIRIILPNTTVFTHLESLNDPSSWHDISLDRPH